ncbi:bifunctional sulfate adenylyltransferase/adenylylsulfate kinase [Candidatus Kaiserbacteria bacterium]|nr:bifunctional sulfate adenylyltransferase/adenylylsulfate kinase [Candidatus Kaiserbacteria bacterium]
MNIRTDNQSILKLKRFNLKDRQLFDLEMLMVGGFNPLTGFMNEKDYLSVVTDMRLANGKLFPIPIVLDIPDSADFGIGESILLCDPFGNPLAVMDIESKYSPDKTLEAKEVYGTNDMLHPGVRYLMNQMHDTYIGGEIHSIKLEARYDFKSLRYTPAELKQVFKDKGWDKVVAFQTRNPMHKVHFELIKRAHKKINAPVLVHPVVGMTREGDIDYITRVHTYQVVCDTYGKEFTMLALLPLSMRMAGPREVLWHMIVRKNYGVTHFIVGRDHAGPGKGSDGKSFYGPYEARDLAMSHAQEVGIEIVPSDELAYSETRSEYVSQTDLAENEKTLSISGTEFRRKLFAGEDIPEWFSFPESVSALQMGVEKQRRRGVTLFFTGLSGAGKSTIANIVATKLLEVQHRELTFLDGDVIRNHLTSELGFSKEHRDLNVKRVAYVASEITKHGGVAICSLIAPYANAREQARELVEQHGTFVEVFVSTSLAVCEERDVKGLYQKARQGLLKQFTGISDPYEEPTKAEIVLDAGSGTPESHAEKVIEYLFETGLIKKV